MVSAQNYHSGKSSNTGEIPHSASRPSCSIPNESKYKTPQTQAKPRCLRKSCVQPAAAGAGNAEVQSSGMCVASLLIYPPCGRNSCVYRRWEPRLAGLFSVLGPCWGCCPGLLFLLLLQLPAGFSWAPAAPAQLGRQELREWGCSGADLRLLGEVGLKVRMRMAARGRPHLRRCLSDHPGGASSWAWDGFWRTAREKRLAGQSKGSRNPTLV